VGLTAGDYTLTASVLGPDSSVMHSYEGSCGFTVTSPVGDTGVTRPAHRWFVANRALAPSLRVVGS
jgi:hypothetical protein